MGNTPIDQRILILASAALVRIEGLAPQEAAELRTAINSLMTEETADEVHHSHYNQETNFLTNGLSLTASWSGTIKADMGDQKPGVHQAVAVNSF